MDYEYYYYQAKNRYYDACSEINSCQNNVNNLEGNKQVKISEINNLKAQLKKYKDALSDIENAIKKEDDMQSSLSIINSSVNSISENFNNMAYSDSVTQKNLKDVYSTEADKTKSTLNSTFETLKSKKSIVTNKISELEVNIQRSETDLQNIKNEINSMNSNIQSWITTKNNASYDMEYYRHKMYEEE